MPEGQSYKEPESQLAKVSKGSSSRIAREHPAAGTPPARKPDRVGVHAPATAVPAHVHRAQCPVDVANIEDVRVAVGEERALLSVRLLLHEGVDLGEGSLGLGLTAEFGDDGAVHRAPIEGMVAEDGVVLDIGRAVGAIAGDGLARARPFLHLAEEPGLEVVSEIGDLHRRVLLGVDLEEVTRDEPLRRPDLDGTDGGEKTGLRLLRDSGHERLTQHLGEGITVGDPALPGGCVHVTRKRLDNGGGEFGELIDLHLLFHGFLLGLSQD